MIKKLLFKLSIKKKWIKLALFCINIRKFNRIWMLDTDLYINLLCKNIQSYIINIDSYTKSIKTNTKINYPLASYDQETFNIKYLFTNDSRTYFLNGELLLEKLFTSILNFYKVYEALKDDNISIGIKGMNLRLAKTLDTDIVNLLIVLQQLEIQIVKTK